MGVFAGSLARIDRLPFEEVASPSHMPEDWPGLGHATTPGSRSGHSRDAIRPTHGDAVLLGQVHWNEEHLRDPFELGLQ